MHALKRAGWRAITSRAALGGTRQGADIVTDFPMVIEVKNEKSIRLSDWWRQAQEQAGDDLPVVVHKRRGFTQAEQWWVTMDLQTLLALVGAPEDA